MAPNMDVAAIEDESNSILRMRAQEREDERLEGRD